MVDRRVGYGEKRDKKLVTDLSTHRPILSASPTDCQSTQSIQTTMQKVVRTSETLRLLSAATDAAVDCMREQLMPTILKRGMASLPDDLLVCIFEFACEYPPKRMATALSHVNQHCRAVLLNMPKFWSNLACSRTGTPEKTYEYLSRSRAVPLSIDLSTRGRPSGDQLAFLDAVTLHASRWATCSVRAENFQPRGALLLPGSELYLSHLRSLCDCRQFPLLTSLSIAIGWQDSPSDLEGVLNDETLHFYSTWKMPCLRRLTVTNFIPLPIFGSSLTSCEIELEMESLVRCNLDSLRQFLEPLSSLSTLSVYLRDIQFHRDGANSSHFPVTVLPGLRSFSLSTAFLHPSAIEPLMQILRAPHVRKLSAYIKVDSDSSGAEAVDNWLRYFFLIHTVQTPIEFISELHISVIAIEEFEVHSLFASIFSALPRLQRLSVFAPYIVHHPPQIHNSLSTVPPLKFLRFEHCRLFSNDFVVELLALLAAQRGHSWDDFDRLEVIGCELFSRMTIEDILPKEKITWTS